MISAIWVWQREYRDVLVHVASGFEPGGVPVLIELQEAQAIQLAVQLAVFDRAVELLARFAPARADVDQDLHVGCVC